MSNTNHKLRTVLTFVVSGVLIVAALWIVLNRQYALDVVTNWTYKPSESIKAIGDRTQLTDVGRFTFYATQPEVLGQEAFNSSCPRQEAGSPILGCYTSSDRIFMYNVTDEKLDGMKEVTAAHEILHAVWQRTSDDEKMRLGALLKAAYQSTNDQALKTRMDYYERTEPGELTNELHSILGTEMANVGDELESYYAQFFNRKKVIELHDNYSKLYLELTNRADTLLEQMKTIGEAIDSASSKYNSDLATFSSDVQTFNQRAEAGSFSSNSAFTAERSSLITRSNNLEADRQSINAQIAEYNNYHNEYQKIGEQLQTLNESMDSYHTIEKDSLL